MRRLWFAAAAVLALGLALAAVPSEEAGVAGESAATAGSREGDTALFFELFGHLEPHALFGLWWGGGQGLRRVAAHATDEATGAPLRGSLEHPETFHDPAEFRGFYRARFGGGNGLLIYNINTASWIAAALALLCFVPMARRAAARHGQAPRGVFYGMLESVVLFVRDEMVYGVIGKEHGRRYVPLFLTMFVFILFMNLLGLLALGAVGGTATANLAVTAGMAVISFVVIQFAGIREHGLVKHFVNYVPHGVPWWVLPIIVPVEILGLFIKPLALTIRLAANMNAGHLLVLTLFGLIYYFNSYPVGLGIYAGAIGIYMLETFVAVVQAYIFTYLTIVFVGATVHPAH